MLSPAHFLYSCISWVYMRFTFLVYTPTILLLTVAAIVIWIFWLDPIHNFRELRWDTFPFIFLFVYATVWLYAYLWASVFVFFYIRNIFLSSHFIFHRRCLHRPYFCPGLPLYSKIEIRKLINQSLLLSFYIPNDSF